MKLVKKILALTVSSLMMFSLTGVQVYAQEFNQKDFAISITSNKTEYTNGEKATIHIEARNNSEEDFYNVSLEAVIPDGLTVVDSNTSAFAESVEVGNKISVDLTVEKSSTESSRHEESNSIEESSKETSDEEGESNNSLNESKPSYNEQNKNESSIINPNNDSPKTGDNFNVAWICFLVLFRNC